MQTFIKAFYGLPEIIEKNVNKWVLEEKVEIISTCVAINENRYNAQVFCLFVTFRHGEKNND
jgi:hypothetical protein